MVKYLFNTLSWRILESLTQLQLDELYPTVRQELGPVYQSIHERIFSEPYEPGSIG